MVHPRMERLYRDGWRQQEIELLFQNRFSMETSMALKAFYSQTVLDVGWLVFLLFVFKQFWASRQQTFHTQQWIKTKGRITVCEWVTVQHTAWPKVEYVYQVGDRDFTSDCVCLDTVHQSPTSAHMRRLAYQIAKAYQENEPIDVYYNPSHSEQSVLDTTIPPKLRFILWNLSILIVTQVIIMILRFVD